MLTVAATPIGNLQDASPRLCRALQLAEVIAAEDTRVARRLMAGLSVKSAAEVITLHDHNERQVSRELALRALDSEVLLLSDAGMPGISDPGHVLIREAIRAGAPLTVLPGASAVITALVLSGLPSSRFCFEGFLPRTQAARRASLHTLQTERRTMVFYESPVRAAACLRDMSAVFGDDRPAALLRELTKLHEEARRGTLAELAKDAAAGIRGEVTIVVGGAPEVPVDLGDALALVRARIRSGEKLKDAARAVAADTGASAHTLYEAVIRSREEQ